MANGQTHDGWTLTEQRKPPREARIDWISKWGHRQNFGRYIGYGQWETSDGFIVAYKPHRWRLHKGDSDAG